MSENLTKDGIMLGIKYIKTEPTVYALHYRRGRVIREGLGLAFLHYGLTDTIVAVPVSSVETPFIFEEATGDFQVVTIQGQVSYRVAAPQQLAALMNFTLDARGQYLSEDPQKLPMRVITAINVLARTELQKLTLREAIRSSEQIVKIVREGLTAAREIQSLGLEILGLSIIAIKPTPETARALEAETRELLLRKADEAIYSRRNSAVEQERAIRENELNTEIAVENKKRQIRETQMDAERSVQEKKNQLQKAQMLANIDIEQKKKDLVSVAVENDKAESDARAYGISVAMEALGKVDIRTVQALANVGMKPEQLIATAFQEIAGRADKIGQLNISPDLLRELMDKKK
jgi:hypothetical protein